MAVVITHNSTADGDPLIDGDDWNANHTITGGGTLLVPQLIESKTLSAETTTTTFSSLDLFTDKLLYGQFDLDIVNNGSERMINLQFNSDTTSGNYDNTQIHIAYSYFGVQHNWGGNQVVMRGWGTGNTNLRGYFKVRGKSGYRKLFECFSGTPTSERFESILNWNDTTNNVTSFTLTISDGSMSGSIELYRMVNITL
jgi:hypothetical protein